MTKLALARGFAIALCAIGCDYGDSDHHASGVYPRPVPGTPVAPIDTDAELGAIAPGAETGVFVEYQSGGRWRIYMVCDVDISGIPCDWDVIAAPSDGIVYDVFSDGTDVEDLLTTDRLSSFARLQALTYSDFDGMLVDANPGAPMLIDVYLDGGPAADLLFWISDGAVNPGAPDNPIELVPVTP
jgi:hypothetical protein